MSDDGESPKEETFIDATAVVDRGATVGAGTKIWHFTHVMPGARIGRRCMLGQNVFVASNVSIGDGCRIQNQVSLYDGVTLERDVFVGPSVVFTNVKRPRAFVSGKAAFASTHIGRGTTIGANATIVCGVTLGPFSFVAAGAVVTRDVPAFALVVGSPAQRTAWVCRCAATLRQDPTVIDVSRWRCDACGEVYLETQTGRLHRQTVSAEA